MTTAPSSAPILVTGAAGFIGGRVARGFAEAGEGVAALDLPGRPAAHLSHPAITLHHGDVTSREDCERVLALARPRAIVHCAALMGGSHSREAFVRVNAGGTRTLADAAAATGVRRFIYISSVTVHGLPPAVAIEETAPVRSIGLGYADSKIAAEEALRGLHEARSIHLTILRPGDVYGPRAHEWVVKLVEAMRSGRMILISGGRGLINATYVDNLRDAVAACLRRDASVGQAYNVTDGAPVTWRRYLEALAAAAGVRPPRFSIPAAAARPMVAAMEAVLPRLGLTPPLGRMGLRLLTARTTYSIEKARRDLEWRPAVEFDEGMRRVGAWLAAGMP